MEKIALVTGGNKGIITGRFATPREVAETIGWLGRVSPEYINGTCIDINNGSFPR